MRRPKVIIDEEVIFDGRSLISETDTNGVITYVNRKFQEMSGYTKNEVVGQPHSILRHPDMPKETFYKLWESIKMGKHWDGYVKNLRKDGKYYWVEVSIVPKTDDNDNIIGYIASRRVPNQRKLDRIKEQYRVMLENEKNMRVLAKAS